MRFLYLVLAVLTLALLAAPANAGQRCHSRHQHNGGCQSHEPAQACQHARVQVSVGTRPAAAVSVNVGRRVSVNVCPNCQGCAPAAAPAPEKIPAPKK